MGKRRGQHEGTRAGSRGPIDMMYSIHLGDFPKLKDDRMISNIGNRGDIKRDNKAGPWLIELREPNELREVGVWW